MVSLTMSKEDHEKSGACSRYLTRLHPLYEVEIQAITELTNEFNEAVGTSLNPNSIFHSPVWGLCGYASLVLPDCLPERLPVLSRAITLGFLHDDYYDTAKDEEIEELNANFDFLLQNETLNPKSRVLAGNAKLKQLQARVMLELLDIDHSLGMAVMNTWSRDLTLLHQNTHNCQTFEEYCEYRMLNGAVYLSYKWGCYALNIKLTPEEEKLLAHIVDPNLLSAVLVNDFHSWPKEVKAHLERRLPGIPPNGVGVIMQENDCSEPEALKIILEKYAELQDIHLVRLAKHKGIVVELPDAHRKYIEFSQNLVGGNEHFAIYSSGRYPSKESLNQPECEIVGGILRFKGVVDNCNQNQSIKETLTSGIVKSLNDSSKNGTLCSNGGTGDDIQSFRSVHTNGNQKLDMIYSASPKPSNHLTLAPYEYISSLPAKGFRVAFIDALDWWMGVPEQTSSSIKAIINALHGASLMLDDIQDDSKLRRGKPATHMLFGSAQTINSATYMIVNIFGEVQKLNNPTLTRVLIDELENLHCGQSFDLHWKFHIQIPSIEDYMMMVDNKTGGQLRLCVRMMQEVATNSNGQSLNFERFVTLLGRYYQVRDDYQNLISEKYTSQKGFCEDLDEGKISFPLIYCLSKSDGNKRAQILGIFRLKRREGLSLEMKNFVLDLMRECDALSYTKKLIQEMQSDLIEELKLLEMQIGKKNPILELSIRKLWI